jgi:putative tricarboxylic transport membrane protein
MKKKYIHVDMDVYISIFLMLLSIYVYIKAGSFWEDSGVAPRLCSILLAIGSLFILRTGLLKSKEFSKNATEEMVRQKQKESKEWRVSFESLGFCLIYAMLIPILGFFTATAAFMIAFMLYLNFRKYWVMLVVTLGIDVVLYFVFVVNLRIKLPTGFLI